MCPRKIRLLPKLINSFKSIIPQTAHFFPMNDESPCSPAIILHLLQILSPAPSFAISRVYAFTVLPLPSLFFPTYVFICVSVRRKLILHSSSVKLAGKGCGGNQGQDFLVAALTCGLQRCLFPPCRSVWLMRSLCRCLGKSEPQPSPGSYSTVPCSVCSLKNLCIPSSKTLRFRGDNLSLNLHINNLHSYCKACYLKS